MGRCAPVRTSAASLTALLLCASLLLFVGLFPRSASAQQLGPEVHEFYPDMVALYDASKELGFEEVSQRGDFSALEAGRSPPEVATWLRFTVENRGTRSTEVFITYLYTFTDFVDI